MTKENRIMELYSSKIKSITKFTNDLHDMVADLYESLVDDDILNAKKIKVELIKQVNDLKIDFQ